MIIDIEVDITKMFMVDVGRPTYFTPEAREDVKEFQTWIKEVDTEIAVNDAFWFIENSIANDGFYGGGGFKYQFWLKSEDDVKKFKERWSYAHEPHKMKYIPDGEFSIYDKKQDITFRSWKEEGSDEYNKFIEIMDIMIERDLWEIVPWKKS